MDIGEIAWVAGIVEGEGCIGFYGGRALQRRSAIIKVAMTDGDVVQHFADVVGGNRLGPYARVFPQKPIYSCCLAGEKAVWWMHLIYWFMGERRQTKIQETLAEWMIRPGKGGHNYRGPKLTRRRPLGAGTGRKMRRGPQWDVWVALGRRYTPIPQVLTTRLNGAHRGS